MACPHCTGRRTGHGMGMMGFYITLCTVHTIQGQGQGNIVFYCFLFRAVCMSHYTGPRLQRIRLQRAPGYRKQIYYRPKRSFGQGNIFTPVCHSFCSRGGGSGPGGLQFSGGESPIFQGGLRALLTASRFLCFNIIDMPPQKLITV